jgi:hypothetical protein
VNCSHGLNHRQFLWWKRQVTGAALGLGRHNDVAAVHVDTGSADSQPAYVEAFK